MPHRPPTRFDIGKAVEFLLGEEWQPAELKRIQTDTDGTYYHVYWINSDMTAGRLMGCEHCRVPYTTPDPIAELSQAADWLAERGQDEAARVLMAAIEERQQRLRGSALFTSPRIWQHPVYKDDNPPEPQP